MWPDACNTVFPRRRFGGDSRQRARPILAASRRSVTRILIADDHEMMRRGVRSVLESCRDVDVCEAQNGAEAVEKTKEMNPDLVILDVSMPVLDGFTAARQIKEVSPLTRILMFSLHRTEAFVKVGSEDWGKRLSHEDRGCSDLAKCCRGRAPQ